MYKRALISFIDILGFKNLIASSDYAAVAKKLEAVKRFSGPEADEDGEGLEPHFIQFSDSIIRIRPLDGKANSDFPSGIIFHELYDLVLMQGELVKHGVCLRGGIAIGDVHYDDKTIFGPGFVRAYEMESQYANFPRIVLDPQVLRELLVNKTLIARHHDVTEEIRYIRNLVQKDADGLFFVDYLNAFIDELDHPEFEPDFLRDHKQLVLSGLDKAEQLSGVAAKYLWLANYHNRLARSIGNEWFKTYGLTLKDIEINSQEMPVNFDWPEINN